MKMHRLRIPFAVLALCGSLLPGLSAQEMKVGIVDMKRIFQDYYKTKEAEKDINEGKAKAKSQLDERTAKYKQLIEKFQELASQVQDDALNPDLREQKKKEADGVGAEARHLEREIADFRQRRERQLQESVVRMRRTILEEIRIVVEERAKRDNYDLVFDRSGLSVNGVPILLHSRDAVDFSDDIIGLLNKDAPAGNAAPPETSSN
ncbi:MAG TPA: OmpH family outer membrane protein [Verrucomicrobiales bacterium]|nr:OmpH family outer membrane protein [Verrucomicrobiales bacterium]